MADLPVKLNASALQPQGHSAMDTSKVDADRTATPAPAVESANEPGSVTSILGSQTSSKSREDRAKHQEIMRKWYNMADDSDIESEEQCRPSPSNMVEAAPSGERMYAMSDPAIKDLVDEKWLAGYLESMMSLELRSAYQDKLDGLDYKRVQHLADMKNPRNPYQIGIRVGQVFGWRALCQAFDRREWDRSLDKHEWTWQQFWALHEDTPVGSFWTGVKAGFAIAQKDFETKQAQEGKEASF